MMQPVMTLKEGDLIDMGAIFDHLESIGAQVDIADAISGTFSYYEVGSVTVETPDCTLLCTNYGNYGVPPTLMVEVVETA